MDGIANAPIMVDILSAMYSALRTLMGASGSSARRHWGRQRFEGLMLGRTH